MSSKEILEFEGSDVQDAETNADEEIVVDVRGANWQPTCPECESRVQQQGHESVCSKCGLVVAVETLDRTPTLKAHAPTNTDRDGEWACEPTNDLRIDKGLHTTFFLSSDAKGNTLPPAKKDKMERLPGDRMAWEALAGGSVLLAARKAGIERKPADVATYAKSSLDRVCAAARKIRIQTDVEAPPIRDRAVDQVVAALDETVDVQQAIELVRVGERLIAIADSECIGPGTHRAAVAGATVYAADRLTDGKSVTQADVVKAASTIVPTSMHQVRSYSREIHDAAETRIQSTDAVAGLVQAD